MPQSAAQIVKCCFCFANHRSTLQGWIGKQVLTPLWRIFLPSRILAPPQWGYFDGCNQLSEELSPSLNSRKWWRFRTLSPKRGLQPCRGELPKEQRHMLCSWGLEEWEVRCSPSINHNQASANYKHGLKSSAENLSKWPSSSSRIYPQTIQVLG